MDRRTFKLNQFLTKNGWGDAKQAPLKGDASNRRYIRLSQQGKTVMVMDAPPPGENVSPFIHIAEFLKGHQLSAPEIIARDTDNGFLILEDFGDDTYSRMLKSEPNCEYELYKLALDVLIHLHSLPNDNALPENIELYNTERLLQEALLLVDWYIPAVTGKPVKQTMRDDYEMIWRDVFKPLSGNETCIVLRDYHVDNLMQAGNRTGMSACGLLDFQDALAGHPAYDVMSLLEDARRTVDADLKQQMMTYYCQAFPALKTGTEARKKFDYAFAALGAGRHAKVIGIFTRLCVRDNKPVYIDHIPRVWGLLETSLLHDELRPLKKWFDEHVPTCDRGLPPLLKAMKVAND